MPPTTIIFDAYGTLFDVGALTSGAMVPDPARLAGDWRRKQLEYSWLRSLMGAHADFAQITAEALDWALAVQGVGDGGLRARLLAAHDRPPVFAEVPGVLRSLRARRLRLGILSNSTPAMLGAAVTAAGLDGIFEAVLSVEEVGVFKPAPAVYALAKQRFGVPFASVLFVSANGWDIAGAARFGFSTLWLNRSGAPPDRLPHGPSTILPDLSPLPRLMGAA